ncbi:DUF192 domain-containing protein [Asticcacaulis sp. AC402]|uniref:DUF192 domain-containing protein n=1 Tax=Asticcacaulis sp. AC402 TaxID=1282361 RepID=UPI0003C3CD81|nr:DUF192 domain-containing protein [Asticcacaulis sp. AC402]ESQ76231.1 hypothetical protein ABAC402_05615 [Asticcacaulis sp. AC402]
MAIPSKAIPLSVTVALFALKRPRSDGSFHFTFYGDFTGWIMSRHLLAVLGWGAIVLGACGVQASTPAPVPLSAAPAECRSMNVTPYSPRESLEVDSGKGRRLFSVEIASNFATRAQGMMCRTQIADNEGMLFEFQDVQERAFWMNNTLISLDIIYIAPDGRIVSIQKNARPLDRTPLPSKGPASGVLEVRGGLSDQLGLKAGDRVIHPFFR